MNYKYAGVDLHKRSFTVCWISENGRKKTVEYKTDAAGYARFKKCLNKECEVAVESSGNTGYFYDQIAGLVKAVKVINTHKFKVISESVNKTDKRDAETISEFLKKDMIPEIRMKTKEERAVQNLINTRDKIVKCRSTLKNQLHGILNSEGIVTERESFGSNKQLEELKSIKGISETNRFVVGNIVDTIYSLNEQIKKLDGEIGKKGQEMKGYKNLISITGIGTLSATILLNTIGNIKNFANEKKLFAYFGIVPRGYDSGGKQKRGHITKFGNKIARTTLVQVTLIAMKFSPHIKEFYKRIKLKRGAGKAIIATARKMLGIIYKTLKNNWEFENFKKFELKKA